MSNHVTEPPPLPDTIVRSENNPYGRTTDWPYGFKTDDTPRKAPIRLLGAMEAFIYWFVLIAPVIFLLFIAPTYWDMPWDFRPMFHDGASWFDTFSLIIAFGWFPFGIIGNILIRGANKFILRTDSRRPSKVKESMFGGGASSSNRGYVPPSGL